MIQTDIRKLVAYGVQTGLVPEEDVIFTTNRLLELFGLEELEEASGEASMRSVRYEDHEYADAPAQRGNI